MIGNSFGLSLCQIKNHQKVLCVLSCSRLYLSSLSSSEELKMKIRSLQDQSITEKTKVKSCFWLACILDDLYKLTL